MKHFVAFSAFFLLLFASLTTQAQYDNRTAAESRARDLQGQHPNAFIAIWRIPGNKKQGYIGLPIHPTKSYDVHVHWGATTNIQWQRYQTSTGTYQRARKMSYAVTPGKFYVMAVRGTAEHLTFSDFADVAHHGDDVRQNLYAVYSLGNLGYTSLEGAFADCTNLDYFYVRDFTLDPVNVTNVERMFLNTSSLKSANLSEMRVLDTLASTRRMFEGSGHPANFSVNLDGRFKTGNLRRIDRMFYRSNVRRVWYLEEWNVSNVTNMELAFRMAGNLRPDVSKWNVSSLVNMQYTFGVNHQILPRLTNWNTSSVRLMDGNFSYYTFPDNYVFPLNTSSVERMVYQFTGTHHPPSNFATGSIQNMNSMYEGATLSYTAVAHIKNWDLSNLRSAQRLFKGVALSSPQMSFYPASFYASFLTALNKTGPTNRPVDLRDIFDYETLSEQIRKFYRTAEERLTRERGYIFSQ